MQKDELLQFLYFYPSEYISAETLARKLGVTRNEIIKYIKELRKEGVDIQGCTNRGFSLQFLNDILTPSELEKYCNTPKDKIRIFSSLPSTNSTAKEMASCGAPEGTIVLAEKQTKGRGRMNRQFFSPKHSGLYMSIILRPNLPPTETLLITALAAVAVAEAAEILTTHPAQIKWVNDVYFKSKKVAGILAEASFTPDGKNIDYVILGIGVNIYPPKEKFPDEIQNIAGALFDTPIPHGRCRVASCILERFFHYYNEIEKKEFLRGYQNRSFLNGQNVIVMQGDKRYSATVIGVNDDFSLRIILSNGESVNLSSGEVSIKFDTL